MNITEKQTTFINSLTHAGFRVEFDITEAYEDEVIYEVIQHGKTVQKGTQDQVQRWFIEVMIERGVFKREGEFFTNRIGPLWFVLTAVIFYLGFTHGGKVAFDLFFYYILLSTLCTVAVIIYGLVKRRNLHF